MHTVVTRVQSNRQETNGFFTTWAGQVPTYVLYTMMLARAHIHERAQRASPAWIPYLADANAIVFHVPISAFNERLDEDPRTNRLGDCFRVWTMICKSELIAKVSSLPLSFVVLSDATDRDSDRCN
jgi:hypothetical protein